MDKQTKQGPRKGRKSLGGEGVSPRISVRLTPAQIKKFNQIGGAHWLRGTLDLAIALKWMDHE